MITKRTFSHGVQWAFIIEEVMVVVAEWVARKDISGDWDQGKTEVSYT
jgi:hypothetical protein